jgi:2-polyprenyl-3-methyl-5-hydroxy-6-metoxy-1,4-benzoquinol methylase
MTSHNHPLKNYNPPFNGERVIEGNTPLRIWQDHVSRYKFASEYVKGKTVFDIACGTGYGTDILRAAGAERVFGADVSSEAIEIAKNRYRSATVEFKVGDILNIDFPKNYFDVITCFETIEHVHDQEKALKEIKKVLKPNGLLIISSPNRKLTSPGKAIDAPPNNPFHTMEYTTKEFISFLKKHFEVIGSYGQRGISKLLFFPFFEGIAHILFSAMYDPEKGKPELAKTSYLTEYRYVTVVCKKLVQDSL